MNWSFRLYNTVAFVTNETSFFVISSRIRVPSENGPFRVDIRHPPSLKSVVRPTSCIPETTSVALTVATNGYLGRRVGVKISEDPNGVSLTRYVSEYIAV